VEVRIAIDTNRYHDFSVGVSEAVECFAQAEEIVVTQIQRL